MKQPMQRTLLRGLWISAVFTGHRMPVAPRCGIAATEMILSKEGGRQGASGLDPQPGEDRENAADEITEDTRGFDQEFKHLALSFLLDIIGSRD
ncbi:hypothetical protein F4782DRAFT_529461 [Xylaria castorea]|nr:hypothetical protein F4782DRAFT_529461 [Xylaria castorea]